MARPTWTGTLQFGLVSVPIRLFPAVQEKSVHFHYVHDSDGGRIHEKRVCEKDGKEIAYEHIARAYEVSKGQEVIFTPEELAKLSDEKNGACEIERFVQLSDIDPVFYAATYHAVADKGAGKSYRLLADAMEKSQRVGIGSIVLRTRENPVAIRAAAGALMLSVLHHGDEVRKLADVMDGAESASAKKGKPATAQELKMAEQLIQHLDGEFDPGAFKDRYRERVEEMARQKKHGGKAVAQTRAPTPDKSLDLMEALRQSLAAPGHRARRPPARDRARPPARARARR